METTHQAAFDAAYRSSALRTAIRSGALDEHGVAYRSSLHRMMWWRSSETIWQMADLPQAGTVLNVGVGFGFDEKVVHQRAAALKLWGVDISSEMIDGALENGVPGEVAVADAEHLPFGANSFDRIVSREVIEHVEDVDAFLAEIVRVARPETIVVITTPNATSAALEHIAARLGIERFLYGTHVFKDEHLSPAELEDAFTRAGLILEDRIFDSAAWFWLNDLYRTPIRRFVPRFGRALQRLEGRDRLAVFFCDQVKYRLRVPGKGEPFRADPGWHCPECRQALKEAGATLRCRGCGTQYQTLRGRAPVFVPHSGVKVDRARTTTVRSRMAFRAAFALHSLTYGPALVVAALAARRPSGEALLPVRTSS